MENKVVKAYLNISADKIDIPDDNNNEIFMSLKTQSTLKEE